MNTDTQASQAQDPSQDTPAPVDTSEASAQTIEAPEATQEDVVAQEATTTEISAEDTAEKLYAGKYKSPEEMEKAYQELQSKFTSTTQEKAELSKILNEAFISPETAQATDTEEGYQDESSPVNKEIEQIKRKQAAIEFITAYPDANADALKEILLTDPTVAQIQSPEAKLEYAYLKSQSIAQPKAIEEARKTAAQQAQVKIVEKQAAQVESVRQSEPNDENSDLMARMSSGSQEQREKARREYIRKNLVNL